MIPLLDDFTHIGFACTRFEQNPQDRFLINGLNCVLGETVDATRWASLVAIVLTLVILDRLCFRERDWRRVGLWIVQPLILVPFFWASQFTTSLSTLWAAAWAFAAVRFVESTQSRSIGAWLPWLLLALLSAGLRLESVVYGGVMMGLALGLRWGIRVEVMKRFALKSVLVAGVSAGVSFWVQRSLQHIRPESGPINIAILATDAVQSAGFYPNWIWPFLQLDSIWNYLRALVLPWSLSFYGNWYRWWTIHESPVISVWPWLALLALGAGMFLGVRRWIQHWRGGIRRVAVAVGFFVLIAGLVSALPRNDWYYPIRAYLAALGAWMILTPLVLARRWLVVGVFAVGLFSTVDHLAFHFWDEPTFLSFEKDVAGADHPFLDFREAEELEAAHKAEEAIATLHSAYKKIPIESARASTRAGTFWNLALYEAWILYQKRGEVRGSRMVYAALKESTYYPMVHACLQNQEVETASCLDSERRNNFCASLGISYPKLKTVREYHESPEKICGFVPQQK
jgi:hypothetical protein